MSKDFTAVLKYFEELSAIPHGSGNTDAASAYCVRFAEERGLEHYRDKEGNVIIKKPAAEGYETAPAVILQGHLDMVCLAEEGLKVDFENEPIRLFYDGDWIGAHGTTLGADDGIAIAMILAILNSDDISHPPLEAVFTVDEEVGMTGALSLDASLVNGKRMINIDSEEEGIITVACAGGVRISAKIPVSRKNVDGEFIKITAGGMPGGHSGMEIDKGIANADKVMAEVLDKIKAETDFRMVSFNGGLRDNAIPSRAEGIAAVGDISVVSDILKSEQERLRARYGGEISLIYEPADCAPALDERFADNVLHLILESPDGVQAMSADIDGMVQTSLNLGIVKTEEEYVRLEYLIRSSVEAEKEALADRVSALIEKYGGSSERGGDYSAWEYRRNSPLREAAVETYREMYGSEPQTAAIHAGLECGIFAGKIEGFDAISIGPDMRDVHTPKERLNVSSARRVYEYVLEILKRSC